MSIVGTYPAGTKPKGYEQIAVTTVKTLTVPKGAIRAVCSVDTQPLRYTVDGTTPTATLGVLVKADVTFEIFGKAAMEGFIAIQTAAGASALNVSYYGEGDY